MQSRTSNQIRFCLSIMLLMGIGTSCEDVIDLEEGDPGNELVIYGKLTDTKGPYEISIGRATSINQPSLPINGALVRVIDQDGNLETAAGQGDGSYRFSGTQICGVPGNSYYAEIILEDGTTYRSIPETMPHSNARDSAYAGVVREEKLSDAGVPVERIFIKVWADTQLSASNTPIYLKWDVHQVYAQLTAPLPAAKYPFYSQISCFFLELTEPQKLHLFSSTELQIDFISEQELGTSEIDLRFFNRHYFNVVQSSITFEAHRYWKQIDQVSNRSGSIFDTPPAKVLGNFYNVNDPNEEVLGYFEVAKMDTSRTFITRQNIPFLLEDPCPALEPLVWNGFGFQDFDTLQYFYEPECLNCRLFNQKASIPRPSYFDD